MPVLGRPGWRQKEGLLQATHLETLPQENTTKSHGEPASRCPALAPFLGRKLQGVLVDEFLHARGVSLSPPIVLSYVEREFYTREISVYPGMVGTESQDSRGRGQTIRSSVSFSSM